MTAARRSPRLAHRGARGLTLLEVLAATLIFALVMTVLVGTSSTAVHRAGQSARRLEANLVADAVIADLEIQMRKKTAPVVEREEWTVTGATEDEQYAIRLQNRAIQEALAAPAQSIAQEAAAAAGNPAPTPTPALPGPGATRIGGAGGIGTLLAGELPEVAKHLRQYDLEVSWEGIDGLESITRTTFAFDWEKARAEFAPLFEAAGGAAAGDDASEEGETPEVGDPKPLPPRGGRPTP